MKRVPQALRTEAQERAGHRCEYCCLPEHHLRYPFHAEHIIARQHGGTTTPDNLAWACLLCNARKGPNIAAYDPESGELTPLYHPRQQPWDDHFEMVEGEIVGKTAIGRATTRLLQFNTPERVELRRALIEAGEW
jgi:hypothetical protein